MKEVFDEGFYCRQKGRSCYLYSTVTTGLVGHHRQQLITPHTPVTTAYHSLLQST